MMVEAGGMGLGISGTRVGVSFAKFAHLLFRNAEGEGSKSVHIYDHFDIGSEGQVSGIAALQTEWFPVNASRYPWLRKRMDLIGRYAIVEVRGTSLGAGELTVDVGFRVLDRFHNIAHEFNAYQISVKRTSLQLGSMAVQGKIRRYDMRTQALMDQARSNDDQQGQAAQ